jgi:hypothetical protein
MTILLARLLERKSVSIEIAEAPENHMLQALEFI